MIYTFLIILIFTFFLIIKNSKSVFSLWLTGVLLGFCISITGFILYSVYFWDYYYLRNILFDINKHLWLFIYSLGISSHTVSRILNIGIGLFYYSVICFSISYTRAFYRDSKPKSNSKLIYIILAFFPIQMILFYDPFIQNELYYLANTNNFNINMSTAFFKLLKYVGIFNRIWFIAYILVSIVLLIRMYLKINTTYIKHKALAINISLITLLLLYVSIFYWAPETIVILRGRLPEDVNNYSYETYIALKIFPSILVYYIYPVISLFSFGTSIFALYKYNILKFANMKQDMKVNTSMKIEQLTSTISHMVKNRLIEINILIKNAKNQDDLISIKNQLNNIEQIADELKHKLDEMNYKNKEISFCFSTVIINDMITYAVTKIKPFDTNININIDLPEKNLECLADEYHLSEVIINIINNAIEAIGMNEGTININLYTERGWNIITVSDNGPGISSKNIKKIFMPFFSTKPITKNWGIGLTYCYKTIKAHRGLLLVDSKTGKGAKFSILLPVIFN